MCLRHSGENGTGSTSPKYKGADSYQYRNLPRRYPIGDLWKRTAGAAALATRMIRHFIARGLRYTGKSLFVHQCHMDTKSPRSWLGPISAQLRPCHAPLGQCWCRIAPGWLPIITNIVSHPLPARRVLQNLAQAASHNHFQIG